MKPSPFNPVSTEKRVYKVMTQNHLSGLQETNYYIATSMEQLEREVRNIISVKPQHGVIDLTENHA